MPLISIFKTIELFVWILYLLIVVRNSSFIRHRNEINSFKLWKLFLFVTTLLAVWIFSESFVKLIIFRFIVCIYLFLLLSNFVLLLVRLWRFLLFWFPEVIKKSAAFFVFLLFNILLIINWYLLLLDFTFFTLFLLFLLGSFLIHLLRVSASWPFPKNLHQWVSLLLFFSWCGIILWVL